MAILIRRLSKLGWFPTSILLSMVLCWYMLHLIQNTPGRTFIPESEDLPLIFDGKTELRVIVLAYNRSESLKRLLDSLALADFLGDRVALDIWVDRSTSGEVCNKTATVANKFRFKFGEKSVYIRGTHGGILQQWLRTWNFEANPSEICVFLEDDLIVSRHFYRWLKTVHRFYKNDDRISGFTLQGAGAIHSGQKALENIEVPQDHLTYLYSMPGTWGFSPKYDQWKNFITFYEETSANKEFHPIIPNDIATEWYQQNRKQGHPENMWSMWYIYFNWKFKKYVLYPNIQPNFQGFTLNWKEPGLNSYGHALKPLTGSVLIEWSLKYTNFSLDPPVVLTNGTVITEHSTKNSL